MVRSIEHPEQHEICDKRSGAAFQSVRGNKVARINSVSRFMKAAQLSIVYSGNTPAQREVVYLNGQEMEPTL